MERLVDSVSEAERQAVPMAAMPDRNFIGRATDYYLERMADRGEEGFFTLPFALLKGARAGREQYQNHRARTLAIATGFVMATAMTLEMSASFSASADLNQANTSAKIVKLGWGNGEGIAPDPLYFREVVSGEGIVMDINAVVCTPVVHVCKDVFPSWANPRLNMQLDGTGQEQLKIPYDAIVAREDGDNKVAVTVDWEKLTASVSYTGKGALVRQYTKSGDTKKFDNQQGFRDNLLDVNAEVLRLVQADKLGNTIDGLKTEIAGDMKERGLDAFKTCNDQPSFVKMATPKVQEAVTGAIQALPGDLTVSSFRLSHTHKSITVDTGQEAATVLGDDAYSQSKYQLPSGKFDLDSLDCTPDQAVVNQ